MKKRIDWIDITKAIGILIVLVNHALLNLSIITYLGGMFYMPIFFVLSGYTLKENEKESPFVFIKNKSKRLLLPYLGFQFILTGLYTIKNMLQGQEFLKAILPIIGAIYSRNALYPRQADVWVEVSSSNIALMSYLNAPLWFFTALFLSLVIYKIILLKAKQNKKKEYIYLGISIAIGVILKYLCPVLLPWSLDTAFISVAFLHLGRILARDKRFDHIYQKPVFIVGILVLFIATSYFNGSGNMSVRDFGKSVFIYLVAGGTGTISAMLLARFIEARFTYLTKILACIGRHTIAILALHLTVFAVVGYVANRNGLTGTILEKVAEIILSVVILVPIDGMIQKYLPFFYGLTRRNK